MVSNLVKRTILKIESAYNRPEDRVSNLVKRIILKIKGVLMYIRKQSVT